MSFKKLKFQPQNIDTPDPKVQKQIDEVNTLFSGLKTRIIEHNSLISASKAKLEELLEETTQRIKNMKAIAEISKATVEKITTLGLQPNLRHYVIVYQKLKGGKQCSDEGFKASLNALTKIEPKLANLKDALEIKEGGEGKFVRYKEKITEHEQTIQKLRIALQACDGKARELTGSLKLLPIQFIEHYNNTLKTLQEKQNKKKDDKDTLIQLNEDENIKKDDKDTLIKLNEKENIKVENSTDSTNYEIQTLLANYSIVMEKKQWILNESVKTLQSLQQDLQSILNNEVANYVKNLTPEEAKQYENVGANKACSGRTFKDTMPLYLFITKLAFCIETLLSDKQKNYCKIRECYDLGICKYESNLDKWLRKLSEDVKKKGSIEITTRSGEKTKPLDFVGSLKYELVVNK